MMHLLTRLVHWAFWYCCDFMVNLGNRTHTSYSEANTWVLLLLIPGLLALLIGVRVGQFFQLWHLRRSAASSLRPAGCPSQALRPARPQRPRRGHSTMLRG